MAKFLGPHDAHSKGGKAVAAKLTAEERSAKARKAVQARKWHPVKKAA